MYIHYLSFLTCVRYIEICLYTQLTFGYHPLIWPSALQNFEIYFMGGIAHLDALVSENDPDRGKIVSLLNISELCFLKLGRTWWSGMISEFCYTLVWRSHFLAKRGCPIFLLTALSASLVRFNLLLLIKIGPRIFIKKFCN